MSKGITVLLLAIFALSILYHTYLREEKFSTKAEKAHTIVEWFEKSATHSYENFRRATGGKSNIVEYEDAMGLYRKGKLSPTSIEKLL